MGLELIEPSLQRNHRLGAESKDANSGVFPETLVGDDPGLQKHAQVPAGRRRGRGHRRGQLARPARAGTKELHDLAPGWIGERNEDGSHFGV